ncbi:MAG TPA: sigma-70 family RNA polymerase sigma factor [Enhygromyxa sp.]|nr:sigma-70 family RNA polymerase sigma factor [Enhygromyxa sp.]
MPRGDRELLLAWKQGDRRAGGELIRRHIPALHRFFVNKVSAPSEVDELVQRTFTACVEGIDGFRGEASFRTWMFAIARNVLGLWIRARTREAIALETTSIADLGVGPSTALAAARERELLLHALRRIPFDQQILLELYYWEDLSAAQIGSVFEIPEATARGRIRKAKLELRAALDSMARTGLDMESTISNLEDWARSLREL